MSAKPPEIEAILSQLEEVLTRWHRENKLGEVAIVSGVNDYHVQERPMQKHDRVPREQRGSGVVKKVTET